MQCIAEFVCVLDVSLCKQQCGPCMSSRYTQVNIHVLAAHQPIPCVCLLYFAQHERVILPVGGLGSIGLGSLGTFSGKSIAIKTAADRAAEAAARIPDPPPCSPRKKRKTVSFVDDGELTRIRYFLKVGMRCSSLQHACSTHQYIQDCRELCMYAQLQT